MDTRSEKPRVSVIIPSYNHARYIISAVRSVLAQTYENWEAIIVDDGSTDDTAAIICQFTDARIRYTYQENRGLSAARNTGILAAQGIYLAFLDADDEWEPVFLQRCVDALQSDGSLAGVYTCNCFIDERGAVLPRLGGQAVSRAAFRSRNLEGGFFPPNAALVRSDVVHEVGLFDADLTSEEDWDLWIRISEHYEMQGIAEPLARYRIHPGSMSTHAARMHANRIAVLSKCYGPPDGDVAAWSEEKRRVYGFAYRSTARQYVQQGQLDEGWRFLARAISTWPRLLEHVSTFYELVCGDQPYGYRGQADLIDIEGNGAEMLKRLDALFAHATPPLEPMRRIAYANAYLALALLSDQAGRWPAARCHLLRAVKAYPALLKSYPVVRRLLKLLAGRRSLAFARKLLAKGSFVGHRTRQKGKVI